MRYGGSLFFLTFVASTLPKKPYLRFPIPRSKCNSPTSTATPNIPSSTAQPASPSCSKKPRPTTCPPWPSPTTATCSGRFSSWPKRASMTTGVKPIVGCEFYVVEDRHKQEFTKERKGQALPPADAGQKRRGLQNLVKLCSLGYIEGMYGKYPRIDKELVDAVSEGLIATTCCIGARCRRAILKKGEDEARKEFKWWLNIFGEDYYVELQRHDIPEQEQVNEVLLQVGAKSTTSRSSAPTIRTTWTRRTPTPTTFCCASTPAKNRHPMDDP